MKAAVMADIHAEQRQLEAEEIKDREPSPTAARRRVPFVSTNDVLSAHVWQAIQSLKARRQGRSVAHVNVCLRNRLIYPSCLLDDDDEDEAIATMTSAAAGASPFYWGNAALQCPAVNEDPAAASLTVLARTVRDTISASDAEAMAARIGFMRKKVRNMGCIGELGAQGLVCGWTHSWTHSFIPYLQTHDA